MGTSSLFFEYSFIKRNQKLPREKCQCHLRDQFRSMIPWIITKIWKHNLHTPTTISHQLSTGAPVHLRQYLVFKHRWWGGSLWAFLYWWTSRIRFGLRGARSWKNNTFLECWLLQHERVFRFLDYTLLVYFFRVIDNVNYCPYLLSTSRLRVVSPTRADYRKLSVKKRWLIDANRPIPRLRLQPNFGRMEWDHH